MSRASNLTIFFVQFTLVILERERGNSNTRSRMIRRKLLECTCIQETTNIYQLTRTVRTLFRIEKALGTAAVVIMALAERSDEKRKEDNDFKQHCLLCV